MITAALKLILDKWADAELHVLTSPDGKRVLKNFDDRLTKVIIYNRKGVKGLIEKARVKKETNKIAYDEIFCFELNPGFLKILSEQRTKISQITQAKTVTNYAQRCLRVVSDKSESQDRWLYLPVKEEGKSLARQQLLEQEISESNYVVGFHPSFSALRKLSFRNRSTRNQKGWPAEHFANLAIMISDYAAQNNKKISIIMDLVPEDRGLGEKIVRLSNKKVKLFIPPLNFERYKAILQRMDLLVSPDTGPMHIAAAVGTNLVALFAGHDPRDCGPYVPDSQFRILRAEDTEHSEMGLGAITPESVFQACKTFLP